jgi:glycosyltransferase involved in cell wall biosynthesis
MTDAPVVSVVTPVYNGQRYLEECIESVLRQTYPCWEYLIFDNVSTDDTGSIADRYAALDKRIRVVHATEFVDVLGNHNRAVRAIDSRSRYLKIVHADDWLYPECLERMVALAETHSSVGVVSSFRLIGNRVDQESPVQYSQAVRNGSEVVKWELLGPKGSTWVTGSDTSLMFRTDFVKQQENFYDPTVWHCDTDTAYRVLMQSDLGFIHQLLTYTRRHPGALTPFSSRVWSFISRDGRLLIRYGPKLLDAREYRRRIRSWLWDYGTWLAKQALKPYRRRQSEFAEFHAREIHYMLKEAALAHDPETRIVLSSFRWLLPVGQRRGPGRTALPWTPAD